MSNILFECTLNVIEEIAEDLYQAVEMKQGNIIPAGVDARWDEKYRR